MCRSGLVSLTKVCHNLKELEIDDCSSTDQGVYSSWSSLRILKFELGGRLFSDRFATLVGAIFLRLKAMVSMR